MNEMFSDDASSTNSAEMAKVKIGYGSREAYAVELSFDYLKNNESFFSTIGEDQDKFGMNIELVKAFDWNIYIYPYFKAGFGAGVFDVESDDKSSLHYSTFNFGLGFFIPINKHFDFEVAYDYKYISYEKLTTSSDKINSHSNAACIGFNIRF